MDSLKVLALGKPASFITNPRFIVEMGHIVRGDNGEVVKDPEKFFRCLMFENRFGEMETSEFLERNRYREIIVFDTKYNKKFKMKVEDLMKSDNKDTTQNNDS